MLVAARIAQAVGAACLAPTSLALLVPAFPPSQRPLAISLWGSSGALAAAVGPSLGGVLVASSGWRSIFLVNLPILAVVIAGSVLLLEEYRDPERSATPDLLSVALLAAGITALALGLVESSEWSWTGTRTLACLGLATVLLLWLTARTQVVRVPLVEPTVFRSRSFAASNLAYFVLSSGFSACCL